MATLILTNPNRKGGANHRLILTNPDRKEGATSLSNSKMLQTTDYKLQTNAAFSLIESLIALAIVTLAVVALTRLHLQTLSLIDQTQSLYHAANFAQSKLEQTLAQPTPTSSWGTDTHTPQNLQWNTTVSTAIFPFLKINNALPLQRIEVTTSWPSRNQTKQITLTTYTTKTP